MEWTTTLEATTAWGERMRTSLCTLKRPVLGLRPEQVGLNLAEPQGIAGPLARMRRLATGRGVRDCRSVCPRCLQMRSVKDYTLRTRLRHMGPGPATVSGRRCRMAIQDDVTLVTKLMRVLRVERRRL
jgi:hypothetical protein